MSKKSIIHISINFPEEGHGWKIAHLLAKTQIDKQIDRQIDRQIDKYIYIYAYIYIFILIKTEIGS